MPTASHPQLTAVIRTVQLLDNRTYRGRMYARTGTGGDDDDEVMGPTLRVKPGQSLWIKLRNNMTRDAGDDNNYDRNVFGAKTEVTVEDYWRMLQNPGEKIKYQYYKKGVAAPGEMKVDAVNVPKKFDSTNLHLHGLDIEVHMFDPVGTHDPHATHVSVDPGRCYCYRFNIPDHHPTGLYWYHPHLHGSTAIQIWGGMLGLLYVDARDGEEEKSLERELARYGVTRSEEFVIWDPAFRAVDDAPTHDLEVDEFLLAQTTLSKIHPFLVNGKMNPVFETPKKQALWLRSVCATIENENTFIVYRQGDEQKDWDEVAIPFYIVGADGVTWSKPSKRNILVMAGGQRYEILLYFDEPGTYVISQQGIQGMQFFDMYGHPHDQILATIRVTDQEGAAPTVPFEQMRFTPGYSPSEDIQAHNIEKTETIVFSMGANRDEAPFPQYFVNGKPFHPDRIDFTAEPGEAREYILINANHNVHPFHIHVNRFQVKEMGSELSSAKYPVLKSVVDFSPENSWRDTVIVAPNGRTRIWVQYKNYTGKTVFHCHFLAHEDTVSTVVLFVCSG